MGAGSAVGRTGSAGVAVRTIRVLLLEGLDSLDDLAAVLQVFPEGDLVAVDDHLVIWRVQLLTTKLGQLRVSLGGVGRAGSSQVVDILQDHVRVGHFGDVAKVRGVGYGAAGGSASACGVGGAAAFGGLGGFPSGRGEQCAGAGGARRREAICKRGIF